MANDEFDFQVGDEVTERFGHRDENTTERTSIVRKVGRVVTTGTGRTYDALTGGAVGDRLNAPYRGIHSVAYDKSPVTKPD